MKRVRKACARFLTQRRGVEENMNSLYLFNKIKMLSFGGVFALCALGLFVALAPTQAMARENKNAHSGWVSLPESERSSFVGIHGGTAPVSVMGSESNPAVETVSGRTGDDFVQVLEGTDEAPAVAQADAGGKAADLVPFGLGETQSASAGSSRLARAEQEKTKSRAPVRLKVDDLKVLSTDDAPVSPESLLQPEELARM